MKKLLPVGEIPQAWFNRLKHQARYRGFCFEISIEWAWDLFLKQKRLCVYSGVPLSFLPKTACLDRKDSLIGYIPNNVHWVHKTVNKIKWNLPEDKFLFLCNAVARNVCV